MLRTKIFSGIDWAPQLETPWKELQTEASAVTPFQTWEWQSTWWKYYSKSRKPHIWAAYEGEDMVGLMPMMISAGPWKTLRAMCSGASDYLHPLCRSGYEAQVSETLIAQIQESSVIDLVDLHQIREIQPLAHLRGSLNCRVLHQATCLVLDLPASFETYLSTLNKSLRYDVRKLDKELFKSGKARIEEVSAENLERGMSLFFETHRKRWRKRGLPGAFVGSRSERFQRDWTTQALENGWLWLSVLHYEENPVGTIYAMRLGKTCFYYQAGFDPVVSSISPGSLLVGYTIRRAISEGIETFDFLRGDEPYKRRWKPQHEYKNLRLLAPTKGVLGRIGGAWNKVGSGVESKVRARLEGKGLFG